MNLTQAFTAQAETCALMGSPFMGQLLNVLAGCWPEDSALGRKFAAFEGDIGPAGHSLPLRIAGGLHALVLTNAAPQLDGLYPPQSVSDDDLRAGVVEALKAHEPFLLEWTNSAPQTNEVRRSAVLMAGARIAAAAYDLPIWLSELGASGGLNMMWDHYALEIDGQRFGPDVPAVVFRPDWDGPMPPQINPVIAERAGVDLNPLNPQDGDDQLRMIAYLWPDQPERLAMTRAAASVAQGPVTQGDAIDWLAPRLSTAPEGHLHLIQHTVAWQYFPAEVQARGRAMIEAAGAQATRTRPLAWLSMESDGDTTGGRGAAVVLRLWPGDITVELGRADFHGRWVKWRFKE